MTIKDGIKFGIGFVIGKALVTTVTKVIVDCGEAYLKNHKESEQTENEDVE